MPTSASCGPGWTSSCSATRSCARKISPSCTRTSTGVNDSSSTEGLSRTRLGGLDGALDRWPALDLQRTLGLHEGSQEVVARTDRRDDAVALRADRADGRLGRRTVHLRAVLICAADSGTRPSRGEEAG